MQIETLFSEIKEISKRNNYENDKEKKLEICKFLIQLDNWNKIHNLTGHSNYKDLIENHVLDAWSAIGPLKKKSIKA